MDHLNEIYVGKPFYLDNYGESLTMEGIPIEDLLDPHPDYLWYQYLNGDKIPHSIGTSLFLGPNTPRYTFSSKMPLYCPESVKWNRLLYYAMPDPKLFDPLPENLRGRILQGLKILVEEGEEGNLMPIYGLDENKIDAYDEIRLSVPGVWSIWGRCNSTGKSLCLDVHECQDLKYEMKIHHEMLEEARLHDYDDDYFYKTTQDRNGTTLFGKGYGPGEVFSMERRSKAISNWCDLKIHPIALNLGGDPGDKFLREIVEAQFAWEWKAVYWNRSYFQPVTQRMVTNQLKNENVMKKI